MKEHTKLVAVHSDEERMVDYYIEQPGTKRIYAFTIPFSKNSYDYCKSGARINEVLTKRSKDRGIMRLVNRTKIMVPYLAEYYDLQVR